MLNSTEIPDRTKIPDSTEMPNSTEIPNNTSNVKWHRGWQPYALPAKSPVFRLKFSTDFTNEMVK